MKKDKSNLPIYTYEILLNRSEAPVLCSGRTQEEAMYSCYRQMNGNWDSFREFLKEEVAFCRRVDRSNRFGAANAGLLSGAGSASGVPAGDSGLCFDGALAETS